MRIKYSFLNNLQNKLINKKSVKLKKMNSEGVPGTDRSPGSQTTVLRDWAPTVVRGEGMTVRLERWTLSQTEAGLPGQFSTPAHSH